MCSTPPAPPLRRSQDRRAAAAAAMRQRAAAARRRPAAASRTAPRCCCLPARLCCAAQARAGHSPPVGGSPPRAHASTCPPAAAAAAFSQVPRQPIGGRSGARLDLQSLLDRLEIIAPEDVQAVRFLGSGGCVAACRGRGGWRAASAGEAAGARRRGAALLLSPHSFPACRSCLPQVWRRLPLSLARLGSRSVSLCRRVAGWSGYRMRAALPGGAVPATKPSVVCSLPLVRPVCPMRPLPLPQQVPQPLLVLRGRCVSCAARPCTAALAASGCLPPQLIRSLSLPRA